MRVPLPRGRQICRYCKLLNNKLASPALKNSKIVHLCQPDHDTRANSVLLLCCWSVLYRQKTPEAAFQPFKSLNLMPYRDASQNPPCFPLTVMHCLEGLTFAVAQGWFDPETFNVEEYECD